MADVEGSWGWIRGGGVERVMSSPRRQRRVDGSSARTFWSLTHLIGRSNEGFVCCTLISSCLREMSASLPLVLIRSSIRSIRSNFVSRSIGVERNEQLAAPCNSTSGGCYVLVFFGSVKFAAFAARVSMFDSVPFLFCVFPLLFFLGVIHVVFSLRLVLAE